MKKLLLSVTLLAAGVFGLATDAQASSSAYLPDGKPGVTQYVRLKKTMDVGIYQKSGNHYKSC
ncbi:hypothetical protein [Levilactobacillus enshiensis]|uniref:hypothetical protein n=1 Tax=Levilactobacillus enshiensis TaxID=2590213 RepID=UPI00117BD9E2|nr:hypothetical protein [Levilactobacillus enshiensis]